MDTLTLQHQGLALESITEGSGPCVLFLHGFPDTNQTWQAQIQALSNAGYRCVAPVMRGYQTQSQSKHASYFVADLAGDVLAWIDELQEEKVHLVGHDWGAIAAYAAANLYPDRFHSVTTLAIPHLAGLNQSMRKYPKQYLNSAYIQFFRIPLVAEWALRRNNFALIERLWQRWSPNWNYPEATMTALKASFQQEGVVEASLGYYRALFAAGKESSQAASTGAINVPVMTLCGENDGCMDARMFENMESSHKFKRGLLVKTIKDAGHFMHLEKPDEINTALIEWISSHTE